MVRIIPRLDIKGPNLVKGIHLEGLRVLGKPEHFARHYYENGADELMYVDVVASLYNRNSLDEIITRTAREIFIPLIVAGGLRSIDDIRKVLRAGADKVSLNTAAINDPEIIRKASRVFGSSTIVVTIEAIKSTDDGKYYAYTDNGRQATGMEVVAWARRSEELGAGEIMVTSVDREGTGEGYDLELTNMVAESVSIPVIAHGGGGNKEHVADLLKKTDVDAVAISSVLHYGFIQDHKDVSGFEKEGNITFLKSGRSFSKIVPAVMMELKSNLISNGIHCRH